MLVQLMGEINKKEECSHAFEPMFCVWRFVSSFLLVIATQFMPSLFVCFQLFEWFLSYFHMMTRFSKNCVLQTVITHAGFSTFVVCVDS
jgi:hypothetical protein